VVCWRNIRLGEVTTFFFFEETKIEYINNTKSPSWYKVCEGKTKESVQYLQSGKRKNSKKKYKRKVGVVTTTNINIDHLKKSQQISFYRIK
jgi:hypothetical protein